MRSSRGEPNLYAYVDGCDTTPVGYLEAWYTIVTLEANRRRAAAWQWTLRSWGREGALAAPAADGRGLQLRDAAGASELSYGGLSALDAAGRSLAAHIVRRGDALAIAVDDAAATYPLTIDPWVQAITLTVTGGADNSNLGWSMVLSEDGSTIVVGAPHKAAGGARGGATYVFTMPAGGWVSSSAPTAQLTATHGAIGDLFGYSVALSADGGTIAAGAPFTPAGGFQRGICLHQRKYRPLSPSAAAGRPVASVC